MTRATGFLLGVSVGALAAVVASRLLVASTGSRAKVSAALDHVNDAFHAAYDDVRATAEDEAPAIVLLGDVLVVCKHGSQVEIPVSGRSFHAFKVAAHAPVAAYTILHPDRDVALTMSTRRTLEKLGGALTQSLAEQSRSTGTATETLSATRAFVESALSVGRISTDALRAFAGSTGRLLARLTEEATELQLSALDDATDRALLLLTPTGLARLQIVVAGDHQARTRSLGMQYFKQRFAGVAGAALRVTYGEGVTSVDEALSLIGKQRFDRELALAFFGDAKQLQQDVLGNAAAKLLAGRPSKTL